MTCQFGERARASPPAAWTRGIVLTVALLAHAGCAAPTRFAGTADSYPHEVRLPDGYAERPAERFPLILFLHGAGGLIAQDHLIPGYARASGGFPFILVAPSTPQGWTTDGLDALLRKVERRFRVDPDRVYLVGLSMGAFGAFALAAAYPDRFAALALVAGGGDVRQACALRDVPIWLFHNRPDQVVPVRSSEQLGAALRRCGSERVRLSLFDAPEPGVWAHNAWRAALLDPQLYAWLLEQRR